MVKDGTCLVVKIGLYEKVCAQRRSTLLSWLGGRLQLPTKTDVPFRPRAVGYCCNFFRGKSETRRIRAIEGEQGQLTACKFEANMWWYAVIIESAVPIGIGH